MKNLFNFKSTPKNGILISCFLLFVLFLSSCETKINFLKSSVVPAATGYVKLKTDKNKNYAINVQISNLAESLRLTPPKSTYIVWIMGGDGNAQNIGQIQTSNLSASLKTISSFKPTKVFITAEDSGNVTNPGDIILTTANF